MTDPEKSKAPIALILGGVAAVGIGALALARWLKRAVAPGEAEPPYIRVAGPVEQPDMADDDEWDEVDEASDESFPASDPPQKY